MQLDPTACPERQSNGSRWLFVDAMLKLPNTQRREQKSFGACQRSRCGHGRSDIVAGLSAMRILAIPAAVSIPLMLLGLFHPAGALFAHRHMTAAFQNAPHSQAPPRPVYGLA